MNESTTLRTKQFTGCASLAALGVKLKELNLFEPIEQRVHIAQKTIKDWPSDKLYDAFISLLAGAYGLVKINTRLRADAGLQRAFGRSRCAEQAVVQDTLNACTADMKPRRFIADGSAWYPVSRDASGLSEARWYFLPLCAPTSFAIRGSPGRHRPVE